MDNANILISEPPNSSTCDVCQGFGDMTKPRGFIKQRATSEDIGYVYTYMHHPNIGTLFASAKRGCHICKRFSDMLNGTSPSQIAELRANLSTQLVPIPTGDGEVEAERFAETLKNQDSLTPIKWEDYENGRVVLEMDCDSLSGPRGCRNKQHVDGWVCLNQPGGFPRLRFSISVLVNIGDPIDADIEHRPCRDLLAKPHIDLLSSWFNTCRTEHKSCSETAGNQSLPKRVLELLGPSDKRNELQVRLIETNGIMQGKYACLSYCWGESMTQVGQTTEKNLQSQLHGITVRNLPHTVVDAIYLCYQLGFQYLWVDRLCIVQDNEKDWEKESSKMCDIYSRSAITIAVLICDDSSQSFLERRKSLSPFGEEEGQATLEYRFEDSGLKANMQFGIRGMELFRQKSFLEIAWSNQFRSIHRKVSHCQWSQRCWTLQEWMLSPRVLHIHSMTLWDCFDGYANEMTQRHMSRPHLIRETALSGRIPWPNIADEYSARSITYGKDRLPALAGLAARFRERTGYTYLAGLWREELPLSLVWLRYDWEADENLIKYADQTTVMPSWTWAALDSAIRTINTELLNATATFVSDWRQHNPSDSLIEVGDAWIELEGHVGVVTNLDKETQSSIGQCWVKAGGWWQFVPDHSNEAPDDAIKQGGCHLLDVGWSTFPKGYWALALQRVIGMDTGRDCFRRLGVAYASGRSAPLHWNPESRLTWERRVVRLI